MFIIQKVVPAVTAGIKSVYIKKPTGDKVILKRISVRTLLALKFGIWRGSLNEIQHGYRRIALHNKAIPNTNAYPATLFEGSVEWPEGYRMYLGVRSQESNDIIYYTIGYEIEVPKKKGWRPPQ